MARGASKYHVIMKILEIIEKDVPEPNPGNGIEDLSKLAEIAARLSGNVYVQHGGYLDMGDKFENIHNSNIINRSVVQDAIKTVSAAEGADVSNALASVAAAVDESENAAAGALFNSFATELNKPEPDKSVLKQCWDGLTAVLPGVATIASASAQITKLFL